MKGEKLELTDSLTDVVSKMSEGNPGAINVMMGIVTSGDPLDGFGYLLDMDDMGMRGPAIWIGFKDHCKQDLEAFKKAVKARDAGMVATIRKQGYNVGVNRFERASSF